MTNTLIKTYLLGTLLQIFYSRLPVFVDFLFIAFNTELSKIAINRLTLDYTSQNGHLTKRHTSNRQNSRSALNLSLY